jgi:hypothetical protein
MSYTAVRASAVAARVAVFFSVASYFAELAPKRHADRHADQDDDQSAGDRDPSCGTAKPLAEVRRHVSCIGRCTAHL